MSCTHTIAAPGAEPLGEALTRAEAGDTICLGPGEYRSEAWPLPLRQDVTLRGSAGAARTVLVGDGQRPLLGLAAHGLVVRLEGLTLSGGAGPEGGAVAAANDPKKLEIVDCLLRGNRAWRAGGGALYLDGGLLILERTRVLDNEAPRGGGLFLDQAARAELRQVVIAGNRAKAAGGGLLLWDGVVLDAQGSTFAANSCDNGGRGAQLAILRTPGRAPVVSLRDCLLGPAPAGAAALFNDGELRVAGSVLPLALSDLAAARIADGGGNRFADLRFRPDGDRAVDPASLPE